MAVQNGLFILHDLHLQLASVQDELNRGPRMIKAKENLLAKRQAELDAIKAQQTERRKLADQKNLQLKSSEAKLADLRTKLNMCNSNREFDILKGQIAADEMANSVLEDEILDAMEQVDKIKVQIGDAEKAVVVAKEEISKATAQVNAAEAGQKEKAEQLKLAVSDAETVLPDDVKLVYRRLVAAFGAEALAAVEKGVCTACYVSLSPQQAMEVRSGKITFCHCGKLIYLKPAE
jgi:predicted  nucleic acid-binding Zn-ribbon protein